MTYLLDSPGRRRQPEPLEAVKGKLTKANEN
jgi:hypothetical protein